MATRKKQASSAQTVTIELERPLPKTNPDLCGSGLLAQIVHEFGEQV